MTNTATVRSDFSFLFTLFTFAKHEDSRIKSNPVKDYDKTGLPMAHKRSTWLTEVQVQILRDACCSDMHRCMIIVGVDTGMRKRELLDLHRNEIDFHLGVITLGNLDPSRTKTGEGRTIPLTVRASEALIKQVEAQRLAQRPRGAPQWNGYVFENKSTGFPISTIKTFWTAVCRRAGFKDHNFHDLRHTFDTRGLHLGCDKTSLMANTGHVSGDSFRRYSHASDESKQRIIERMNESQKRHTSW